MSKEELKRLAIECNNKQLEMAEPAITYILPEVKKGKEPSVLQRITYWIKYTFLPVSLILCFLGIGTFAIFSSDNDFYKGVLIMMYSYAGLRFMLER
jgi:hypothetical protein